MGRSPRRYRGKDVVEWPNPMGYNDLAIESGSHGFLGWNLS